MNGRGRIVFDGNAEIFFRPIRLERRSASKNTIAAV